MVVAHLICMGTCPVTQVSFQQPCEVSGAVSKSFPPYVLDGLATKNAIFGLLRPCSQWSISSICRDSLVLKSCLAVTLPHQVMMSPLKPGLFGVCGARTKCADPFLFALDFRLILVIFGANGKSQWITDCRTAGNLLVVNPQANLFLVEKGNA